MVPFAARDDLPIRPQDVNFENGSPPPIFRIVLSVSGLILGQNNPPFRVFWCALMVSVFSDINDHAHDYFRA